ncbi:MAG: hypothetical protein HWD60_02285 [Defluviicoccus sp.]|nr:MAG: hypothetical protein HWD60_02285 [Defluviicoccus sp.]
MRSLTSASSGIVVALIVGTVAIATAHANGKCGTSYSVTDIGTLGGLSAFAEGMNNRGDLVGYSFRSKDFTPHAFVWSRRHGMRELKDLSTSSGSFASAINDRGRSPARRVLRTAITMPWCGVATTAGHAISARSRHKA